MLQWIKMGVSPIFSMSFQFRVIFHWTMITGIPGYQNHGISGGGTCDSPASNKSGYRKVKFFGGEICDTRWFNSWPFDFPKATENASFWVRVTFSVTIPKRSRNPSIARKMLTNFDSRRWGWRRGEMPSLPQKLGDVNFVVEVSTADKLYIYVYTRWAPTSCNGVFSAPFSSPSNKWVDPWGQNW